MKKILVILGPTSSGKSDIAIKLAKKFGGEIISADSRQIFRGMDVGTGKIEGKLINLSLRAKAKQSQKDCRSHFVASQSQWLLAGFFRTFGKSVIRFTDAVRI